jgi:hypothetical protein
MTSVDKTPYSLKDYNEIIGNYNNYLRVLYANNTTILDSIKPPLNANNQILFMPFLQEFIKDSLVSGVNLAGLNLPNNIPNFTNYSISSDPPDYNDLKEDNDANEKRRLQETFMTKKNTDSKLLQAKLMKFEKDDTDESGEKGQTLATLKSAAKSAAKTILNKITDKLTAKQMATQAKAAEKQNVAEAKAQAEKAITVFDEGLKSFEINSQDKYVIPPNLYSYPSAVGLYDSLHDFGYEICDTESDKKTVGSYGYSKFMFTYLLYGGYPELNNIVGIQRTDFNLQDFQANYSYLKGYTRPISPEGLENYFAIGNMYDKVRKEPSLHQRIEHYNRGEKTDSLNTNTDSYLQIVINTKLNYLRTTDKTYFVVDSITQKNPDKLKITSPLTDSTDNPENNRSQKQLDIYDYLADFFKEYRDPKFADSQVEGKIKLCIDFQSNLNKIMRKNKGKNKFCLLYTAETITDSASKSKAEAIDETFGFKNWYIEALNYPGNGQKISSRGHYGGPESVNQDGKNFSDFVKGHETTIENTYSHGYSKVHSVKGNISVKYNSINYNQPNDLQNSDYIVNLEYYFENGYKPLSINSITINKKQTAKTAVTDKVNSFVENVKKKFKFLPNMKNIIETIKALGKNSTLTDRNTFYNTFDTKILSNNNTDITDLYKEYALYYAIKRLGDTLQAEVCRLSNLQHMLFYRVRKVEVDIIVNQKTGKIKKETKYEVDFDNPITPKTGAVLVTHDRMLFAYAVINNIPAILDMENHMIIFKPNTGENDASLTVFNTEGQGAEGQELYTSEMQREDPEALKRKSGEGEGYKEGEEDSLKKPRTSEDPDALKRTSEGEEDEEVTKVNQSKKPRISEGEEDEEVTKVNQSKKREREEESTPNGGGNHIQTGGDARELTDAIFSNIDPFMRYLYFLPNLGSTQDTELEGYEYYGTKNINYFLEMVCKLLYNENSINSDYDENLHIEYITNYKYNVLLIGTPVFIDIMTVDIEYEAELIILNGDSNNDSNDQQSQEDYGKMEQDNNDNDDDDLLEVNSFIYIYIDDNNYLKITREQDKIQLDFNYNGVNTKTDSRSNDFGIINDNMFTKENILNSLTQMDKNTNNSILETLQNIWVHGSRNLTNTLGKRGGLSGGSAQNFNARGQKGLFKNLSNLKKKTEQQSKFTIIVNPQTQPQSDTQLTYQEILGADFDKLNNPTNLLQNNIMVLSNLHELLREYELSFINYEEAIDTFYGKIDESVQLSNTIGLYNFMPRDIEFYVFLTRLIQEYNATTITTINFALFEYYLYMTKEDNDIYFHYLTIKSYLLEESYQISMAPDIPNKLQENAATYEFFQNIIKEVNDTSYTITEEIYIDIQTKNTNYEVTYRNVNTYNLKLCGFSDLKEIFTNKTFQIIGQMINEDNSSIKKYIPYNNAIRDGKGLKTEIVKKENKPNYLNVKKENFDALYDYPLVSNPLVSVPSGGKINKSTRRKYRKEKSKTKRKKTKRQQTKVQVNQTKKNIKNKKKHNTKRKIE